MKDPRPPRILFLEDDEDARELVSIILHLRGIDTALVSTRSDAWNLANEESFDLFLLDGLVPNGDSFRLCADLRELRPHTPIVFYSAMTFPIDIPQVRHLS